MKIRNTKHTDSHVIGLKPEVSTLSQSKLKPVVCPDAGTGARSPCWGPGGGNRILLSAWFLAVAPASWEFRLHLELASSLQQVWQSPGP